MFEINLVPDVKAELLRKQRMSNLILFICIIVAAASAGLVFLLGSVVTGQNIIMANQDREIACRSTGVLTSGSCGTNYGTAVLEVENLNEFLTIQDQMGKLSIVNGNKLLLSRVFGVLDVILPTGDDVVNISELNADLETTTLTFDAQGDSVSNIDYRALEVFKKSASLSYYDHGRYLRKDSDGNFVEIPTMCITEQTINGALFGIYHKGKKGCEAPLLNDIADENSESETNTGILPETINPTNPSEISEATEASEAEITEIPIRRIYSSQTDKDEYIADNTDNGGGYYFESQCIVYGSDGRFGEADTLDRCPLLSSEPIIRDSSNGRDSNGRLVLRFNATIVIERKIFLFSNKHMRIVGPSRQNVTDSYTQIRNMFTEKAADCAPDDEQCNTEANNNGS